LLENTFEKKEREQLEKKKAKLERKQKKRRFKEPFL